jgi:hypothetical protein
MRKSTYLLIDIGVIVILVLMALCIGMYVYWRRRNEKEMFRWVGVKLSPAQNFDAVLWMHMQNFVNRRPGRLPSGREHVSGFAHQKNALKNAVFVKGLGWNTFKFLLAAGMMESRTMRNSARDHLKDGGVAANYSFLNLNQDMIGRAIPDSWKNAIRLYDVRNCLINQDTQLGLEWTVMVFQQCVNYYGVEPYIRFVRGGWDAWSNPGNGYKYKMDQYLDGFAMTLRVILNNQNNILGTDERFWVNVDYV